MTIGLDCQEAGRLLSRAQDEPLPVTQAARLRWHLLVCATCRRTARQLRFLRQAMATMRAVKTAERDDSAAAEPRH